MQDFEQYIRLSLEDDLSFSKLLKVTRTQIVHPPKTHVSKIISENSLKDFIGSGEISQTIRMIREKAYGEFLQEESLFNFAIMKQIGEKFNLPKSVLEKASAHLLSIKSLNPKEFYAEFVNTFGQCVGNLSPYIYKLCLSNTQSRRSRAGHVFEQIIYSLYDYYNYPYESQSKIGTKRFTQNHLGKIVDSVLPSVECFEKYRNKTIIGSMKTTLRERWSEVVEEINRSNLPNIHLLTLDEDISKSKSSQMSLSNIILVVYKEVKALDHNIDAHPIIDFETYFLKEIPTYLSYWGHDLC